MIALAIICAFILILLFLPVKVKVTYLLYKDTNHLMARGGIIFDFITLYDSHKPKKKMDLELILALLKEAVLKLSFFKKRLIFDMLKLHFHIGFEDAAKTGAVTGGAWSALYNITSLVDHNFKLKDQSLHICPEFNQNIFETDIEIRVSIKVIFLLIFALKAYKNIKKLSEYRKED